MPILDDNLSWKVICKLNKKYDNTIKIKTFITDFYIEIEKKSSEGIIARQAIN